MTLKRWKLPISRQFLICLFGYLFGCTVILLNNSLILNFKQQQKCSTKSTQTNETNFQEKKFQSNLLMVGIMTAEAFVENRAITVWQTWAQNIAGKLLFFVSETTPLSRFELNNNKNDYGMPLIRLKGVNDVYPPQKKSFAMLRWMYDNYVSNKFLSKP